MDSVPAHKIISKNIRTLSKKEIKNRERKESLGTTNLEVVFQWTNYWCGDHAFVSKVVFLEFSS